MSGANELKKGRVELVLTKKNPTIAVEMRNGRVTTIYSCSELLGHIYNGDYIDSVNGQKVLTTAEMTAAVISHCPGKIAIEFRRDEHCIYNLKPLAATRSGIENFEITLMWRSGGTPVGLLIHRDSSGRVIVAMVESGSTASRVIRPGDFLTKVNGKDVTDRDVARKLIMESINSSKKVCLTLERQKLEITAATSIMTPLLPEPAAPAGSAKNNSDYTPTTFGALSGVPPASPVPFQVNRGLDALLPADVLEIMSKNKIFFKANPSASGLKKIKGDGHGKTVFDEKHEEISVPFDPSNKPLKKTPARVGS